MPRPRKNGKNISFYMDAEIVDRFHDYAEFKGQSLTVAAERIFQEALDRFDEELAKKVGSK